MGEDYTEDVMKSGTHRTHKYPCQDFTWLHEPNLNQKTDYAMLNRLETRWLRKLPPDQSETQFLLNKYEALLNIYTPRRQIISERMHSLRTQLVGD